MNRVLLNTQRQELHALLLKHDIDPAVTKWSNEGKGWASGDVETLEAGLCHFLFHPRSSGTFSIHFRPSLDGGSFKGEVEKSWREVLQFFDSWAKLVREELNHEDPWQRYSAYLPPERIGNSKDNSPFTYKEAEHAARAVSTFLTQIRKELPSYREVAEQFDPQFERIAKHAKEGLGRVDWSNQFVGMLIGLCMALALEPETASSLWKSWLQIINGLLLS